MRFTCIHAFSFALLTFFAWTACSTETSSNGTGASQCESMCSEAEKLRCGGGACVSDCENERKSAPAACEAETKAYFKCAATSKGGSCSGGVVTYAGCSEEEIAYRQCVRDANDGAGGGGGAGGASSSSSSVSSSSVSSSSTGMLHPCAMEPSCGECVYCAIITGGPCKDADLACEDNNSCLLIRDCIVDCTTAACVNECKQSYPSGAPAFDAWEACSTCGVCVTSCPDRQFVCE